MKANAEFDTDGGATGSQRPSEKHRSYSNPTQWSNSSQNITGAIQKPSVERENTEFSTPLGIGGQSMITIPKLILLICMGQSGDFWLISHQNAFLSRRVRMSPWIHGTILLQDDADICGESFLLAVVA
jgi:hypothetical protein